MPLASPSVRRRGRPAVALAVTLSALGALLALLAAPAPASAAAHLEPVGVGPAGERVPQAHALSASDDGRFVAFVADADDPLRSQLYLRDRALRTTRLVSRRHDVSAPSTGDVRSAVVSQDGAWVAFTSTGTDLDKWPHPSSVVFMHDVRAGSTEAVYLLPGALDPQVVAVVGHLGSELEVLVSYGLADQGALRVLERVERGLLGNWITGDEVARGPGLVGHDLVSQGRGFRTHVLYSLTDDRGTELRLRDASGAHQVLAPPAEQAPDGTSVPLALRPDAALNRDGSVIAYSAVGRDGRTQVRRRALKGQDVLVSAAPPADRVEQGARSVDLSPDGGTVVFEADTRVVVDGDRVHRAGEQGGWDVFAARVVDGAPTQVWRVSTRADGTAADARDAHGAAPAVTNAGEVVFGTTSAELHPGWSGSCTTTCGDLFATSLDRLPAPSPLQAPSGDTTAPAPALSPSPSPSLSPSLSPSPSPSPRPDPAAPLPAPQEVAAAPADGGALLSWTWPVSEPVGGWQVEVLDPTSPDTSTARTLHGVLPDRRSVRLDGLRNGVPYRLSVRALSLDGAPGAWSAGAWVTPGTVAPSPQPSPPPAPMATPTGSPQPAPSPALPAPGDVSAVPGDGSALLSWSWLRDRAPAAWQVEVHVLDPGATATATATTLRELPGGLRAAGLDGLDNGLSHRLAVRAVGVDGTPGPWSAGTWVTPVAGAPTAQVHVGTTVPEGSPATIAAGAEATPEQPVTSGVEVPPGTAGGALRVTLYDQATVTEPTGYAFFGSQVDVVAPAALAQTPLRLTFTVDAGLLGGTDPASVTLVRTEDGVSVPLPDCTSDDGTATPDPCVSQREMLPDGDLRLTALTSHASSWNAAVVVPPVLDAPALVRAVATSSLGATVVYAVTATTTGAPGAPAVPVHCTGPSGSAFPLGTTTVTCTAGSGPARSSVSFPVVVAYEWSDLLSPVKDGARVVRGSGGLPVRFQLTGASAPVTDAVAVLTVTAPDGVVARLPFRYRDGQYALLWQTKGLRRGTYRLDVDLGDGSQRPSRTVSLG